ncbi:MAG: universal stress protein [Magnetococcales bacterium]|nr:universal stress protein [Magnetococcales bacterium]
MTSHSSTPSALPAGAPYQKILVALDSSAHADRGLSHALTLAQAGESAEITGIHAYAAKLHDMRFRQMEGGLPEQFRKEEALEEQRETHDDLITKGLDLITESYLDVGKRACEAVGIAFRGRSVEGKNYAMLAAETQTGHYDLLVMGSQGVGAVPGERLGGVCDRVSRRTAIDTLVVKEPERESLEGPIVVAVDGSELSYGGLMTAMQLCRHWKQPLILVAAYDPYYHYVVFNNIAGILSQEGKQVFKFEEQEKLHEEIIDSGLAKIYQAHLDVARTMAEEQGLTPECVLLAGKPTTAITTFLEERKPALAILGKTGIHADDELDVGRVTDHLLREAGCNLLLSCRTHVPETDRIASFTTSWTEEAEARLNRAPSFVRKMARMAILRYAQDRGHTVITARIVEEATAALMPGGGGAGHGGGVDAEGGKPEGDKPEGLEEIPLSAGAQAMLGAVADPHLAANVRLRAQKAARQEKSPEVTPKQLARFLPQSMSSAPELEVADSFQWSEVALERINRAPEGFMRDAAREHVLEVVREQNRTAVTLEDVEAGLVRARDKMMKSQS